MPTLLACLRDIAIPVILGPTCVGKTSYIQHLLASHPLEVINMDSFQLYAHFRIGTGRFDALSERTHLYGFLDPHGDLTTNDYLAYVCKAIQKILLNGNLPIFEGGSITLLRALLTTYQLRLIGIRPFDSAWMERRVAERMNSRFHANLLEEIKSGLQLGYRTTRILSDDIVYLPIVQHLDGETTLEAARQRIHQNLLGMIKRQMAEYGAFDVEWLYPNDDARRRLDEIIRSMFAEMKKKCE